MRNIAHVVWVMGWPVICQKVFYFTMQDWLAELFMVFVWLFVAYSVFESPIRDAQTPAKRS